jgi:hypothetical protein
MLYSRITHPHRQYVMLSPLDVRKKLWLIETQKASNVQLDNTQGPSSILDSLLSKPSSTGTLSQKPSSKPQHKIKLMDPEQNDVSSGSSLSTKQRLSQRVIGTSNPNPHSKAKIASPRSTKKIPLAKLGFKKHPVPLPLPRDTVSGATQSVDEPLFSEEEEEEFFMGGTTRDIDLFNDQQPVEDRSVVFDF